MERALYRTGWVVMSLFIALLILTTLRYFGNDSSVHFQPEVYFDRIVVLRVHIAASIVAALTGPMQLVPYIRNKFRAVHRTVDRIYVIAVLIGAVFGLLIATTALGGVVGDCLESCRRHCPFLGSKYPQYRQLALASEYSRTGSLKC